MFAARDQENLVHGHQQVAASKPLNQSTRGLQPKTPGNKFPKTPLKVPLNDENAPTAFGGKGTVKGKGLGGKDATIDKNAFVTPMGPRNRAPLGMKTTNAKTKVFQTPAGPAPEKELEKTISKQTSARRPRPKVSEKVKIDVHGDESPLGDVEVEYMPPRSNDIPYDSDIFPKGCLNYDMLKPGNLTKGSLGAWYNTVDKNGKSQMERESEEGFKRSAQKADEQILAAMEEDWTIGDVPETFKHLKRKTAGLPSKPKIFVEPKSKPTVSSSRGPTTTVSRRAVSALSTIPKATSEPIKRPATATARPASSFLTRGKKPMIIPSASNASMRHTSAVATSKTTIGYTKGRTASSVLHQKKDTPSNTLKKREMPTFPRSISNLSHNSDSTITPARFAQENVNVPEYKRLDFLNAFEHGDDEDLEPGLRGALPECMKGFEEDEEEFIMTLGEAE